MSEPDGLTIRQVAERTGVSTATLRVWEARHGFPRPERRPSGHRRYSEAECERVSGVVRDRAAGLSLPAAIERNRAARPDAESSIFAGLRRRRPDLDPYLLPKRTLIGMSHAIEDECCARAERALLVASFQTERHYREAESRWRDLARTAELAVAFADFAARRDPAGGPVELPLRGEEPLGREWTLLCEASRYSACLSAWERPGQDPARDLDRMFETVWTVEPTVVRTAVALAVRRMDETAPDLVERLRGRLGVPLPHSDDQVRLVAALGARMVAYVGRAAAEEAMGRRVGRPWT
jgi:DICT domain-containing protein